MGELVVGRPVMRQLFAVSAPLVLTSAISLTFRAVQRDDHAPNPGFDPWLIEARKALSPEVQHDLDVLLGFSGRLLYYIEELLFSFDALEPGRLDADYQDYNEHLSDLPPAAYQRMAANAVRRVYLDRGVYETPPESNDIDEWRMFLRPSVSSGDLNEIAELITHPEELKHRTLRMIDGFWRECYEAEYQKHLPLMRRAVRQAQTLAHPVVQVAFSELTGHRLPDEVAIHLADVERVTFCPSVHLGSFVQYIFYQPELILYFNPQTVGASDGHPRRKIRESTTALSADEALTGFKAIADPTRMRIITMLREREHYAQEIVGKLGISQSAVSRHLSTLEAAGLITVRPAHGMKYYAVEESYLRALGDYIYLMATGPSRN
ncbi:MAG: ArsR/SmtB family transcription factor, partial [Chloroflexota bacterium]